MFQNLVILSIFLQINLIFADNFTAKFPSFDNRKGRLLSFNTEESEINIELDFSVPFLKIPLKKSMDKPHGGIMANLNVGALALAGMMAFGAAFVVPATYGLFNKTPKKNRHRSDEESSSLWQLISSLDQALSNNNIDSTSCLQRAICLTVQNSNSNLVRGEATSNDKIIDGLATNPWLNYLIDGTVIQAAISSGLNGFDCTTEFPQCRISQKSVQMFGKQLMNSLYSK